MARNHENIDPLRLCDAAEAVLKALVEYSETTGAKAWPYPPSLMGRPDQPEVLTEYTRDEVEEATHFLLRMGWLELPKARKS